MIDSLRGTLLMKTTDSAVLEVGGVGFRLGMSVSSLSDLPALGEEVFLYTRMNVREDALTLFGFTSLAERDMFDKLTSVSGIGPKVALSGLSTFSASALADAIMNADSDAVSRIPGVGKKTAQRIVLELKVSLDKGLFAQEDTPVPSAASNLASQALLSMGFSSAEADLALQGFEGSDINDAIKYALRKLGA